MTTGPASTGAKVASGSTGTSHSLWGSPGTSFLVGQTVWLSFFYSATRVTGTNTMTLVPKIHWYNGAGAEVAGSPTASATITINGTTGWVFTETAHTPPTGAVSARPEIVATPLASPMQHDLVVTRIRGSKAQTQANYVTNTNQLTDGSGLGTTATWSGVTGTGKPADNATVNNVTYSASAPTGGTNGDVWVYTGVTPNVVYVRVAGAWQVASNYTTNTNQLTDGANLGVTASWPSVSGTGKPADYATQNNVTYSAAAPSGGQNGDIWVNTTAMPYTWYVKTGGVWNVSGNYTTTYDHLSDGTTYGGMPLVNTSGTGTSRRALIDFTQGHANNSLDNINDGATYARLPGANTAGTGTSRRALIDFTQGHANNSLDNIGDGATYARLPGANTAGTGTSRRALIDFTQSHANKSLANVDSTANTKLGGIAAGADVTANVAAIGDANRVRFSRFEGGLSGWQDLDDVGITQSLTATVNAGLNVLQGSWSFTATNQQVSIGTVGTSQYLIPVAGNERLFVSATIGHTMPNVTGMNWYLQIGWLNASNVEIMPRATIASGQGPVGFPSRQGGFVNAPAAATMAFLRLQFDNNAAGAASGIVSYFAQPMVCSAGSSQTSWPAFTPGPGHEYGATAGAAWGGNLSGRPSNLSALGGTEVIRNDQINVSGGTLNGIGTGNGTAVANTYVATGNNQLVNSDFTRGLYGFIPSGVTSDSARSVGYGVNVTPGYYGMRNVFSATVVTGGAAWTNTGSNYADALVSKSPWSGGSVTDMKNYAMPCTVGDNVYLRCLGAQHRCTFQIYLLLFNSSGTLVDTCNWFGARDLASDTNAGRDGNPANYNLMGGTYTVSNSTVCYAAALFRMLPNGGSDPYIFVAEPAMGRLPAGQTALPPYSAGPADSLLTVSGSGIRVGDARQLPAITGAGARYKFNTSITYTGTAGSGSATIQSAAGSAYIGSNTISYNANSVSVSGSVGSTVTQYLYWDDPSYAGGTPQLQATTDGNVVYQNDGRVWVGSVDVYFAPTGGSTGGTGGSGGGLTCVAADAWVETRDRGFVLASHIHPCDLLRCLTEDGSDTEWMPVLSNKVAVDEAYRLTSKSGIELRVSHSTPLTLRDGSSISVPELDGHELPVFVHELEWEPCTAEPIGKLPVCYISLGGRVYAAGDVAGQSILTHNPTQKP